ncbi:MAG: hypothetical protein [Caudoviricetes sp.]|nr:MAG: hypothetical protein [Caudoviricetes sp.]
MGFSFVSYGDYRSANYRGHHIDLDISENLEAINPREDGREYWLRFISTNNLFPSPETREIGGEYYKPTGDFYKDIYRFSTGDIEGRCLSVFDYTSKAKRFVTSQLIVFPIILETNTESLDWIYSLDAHQGEKLVIAPLNSTGGVDISNPFLVGAFVTSIKRAKREYGTDKSIEELRALVVEEVTDQLNEYNWWLSGEVYNLTLRPNNRIYANLMGLGYVGEQIVDEWNSELETYGFEVWGSVSRYKVEMWQLKEGLDRMADWVARQLDTFNDSQISLEIKVELKKLLAYTGDWEK